MPAADQRPLPVAVAIPVRNEAANLGKCLERLGRFAEVVVIDSGSTDATVEIARRHGARVVDFRWNGQFPKKRNWLLLNDPPRQPWVLFLDADEFVDDRFCDAVLEALEDPVPVGHWINYSNVFLGRPLRHGLRQRKLALFRVGSGLYERIDEDRWSALDMEVHEHPIINGPLSEIGAPVEHRDYKGLSKFIERHGEYARWEARRFLSLRDGPGPLADLTMRQRFKYRHLDRWWYPWFYFTFTYVLKLGFLDGAAGFHYAFYKAWYFQTIRLLVVEEAQTRN